MQQAFTHTVLVGRFHPLGLPSHFLKNIQAQGHQESLSASSHFSSIMAGIDKLGAPKLGPQADAGKVFKLAQRVEKTLSKMHQQ